MPIVLPITYEDKENIEGKSKFTKLNITYIPTFYFIFKIGSHAFTLRYDGKPLAIMRNPEVNFLTNKVQPLFSHINNIFFIFLDLPSQQGGALRAHLGPPQQGAPLRQGVRYFF